MTDYILCQILTKHSPVKTKVSNYPDWITNNVLDIDEENIHIEFRSEYLKLLLTVGDSLNLRFQHDNVEYTVTGFVENIIIASPPRVIVRVENIISNNNNRKFSRWNINLLCRIVPTDEHFKIQGITTDISEGGIAMVSYADFNVQELVDVEIISSENDVLKFRGNIRRLDAKLNNHIQYGIEIVDIDPHNKSILEKIISNIKSQTKEGGFYGK